MSQRRHWQVPLNWFPGSGWNSTVHSGWSYWESETWDWPGHWLRDWLGLIGGRPDGWPEAGQYWRRRDTCSGRTEGPCQVWEYGTAPVLFHGDSTSPEEKDKDTDFIIFKEFHCRYGIKHYQINQTIRHFTCKQLYIRKKPWSKFITYFFLLN